MPHNHGNDHDERRILSAIERMEVRVKALENSLYRALEHIERTLRTIEREIRPQPQTFPTAIAFQENKPMLPTAAGNTQSFTGTLVPAGATYPADTTFTVTSNDPAITPTVDATGLIVTGALPLGWVESATTPLAYAYTATSVSASGSITATITPSAPPVPVSGAFPTGVTFAQSV